MEKNENSNSNNSDKEYYWIKLDTIDFDSDGINISVTNNYRNFIYYLNNPLPLRKVKDISENTIALSIPLNETGYKNLIKTFIRDEIIKSQTGDKPDFVENLSNMNFMSFDEAVYYLSSNWYFYKSNLNYLSDDVILFLSNRITESKYTRLMENYEKNILENPSEVLLNKELKNEVEKTILSDRQNSETDNNQSNFIRFIHKIYEKTKNSNNNNPVTIINMLSNCFYNPNNYSNDFGNLKMLIQSLSLHANYLYELHNPSTKINKLYCGLKLLEIFGCSFLDDTFITYPQFNMLINLNLDLNNLNCEAAKIEIISFNKNYVENIFSNTQKDCSSRNFGIFHILYFLLNSNDKQFIDFNLDFNKSDSLKNWFSKKKPDWEKYDSEIFMNFVSLLKIFEFSKDDIQTIIKSIILFFLISDLKFVADKPRSIILIKTENEFLDYLEQISILNDKEKEKIKKVFLFNLKDDSENSFKTVEECQENVKTMRKILYESLFYFIVNKINSNLNYQEDNKQHSKNLKEIIIANFIGPKIRENSIKEIYDVFNLYLLENSLKNFEFYKIDNLKEKTEKSQQHSKNSEIIENLFSSIYLGDNKLNKKDKNSKTDLRVKIEKKEIALNIEEILKQNSRVSVNLNELLSSLKVLNKENIFLMNENLKNYSETTLGIFKEFSNKFSSTTSEKYFIFNFSEIIEVGSNIKKRKNAEGDNLATDSIVYKISKALIDTNIKSFIENPLFLFSSKFNCKEFYQKFIFNKENKISDSLDYSEIEEFLETNNIDKSDYLLGESNIFIKNSVLKKLENLQKFNENKKNEIICELNPARWVDNLFQDISKRISEDLIKKDSDKVKKYKDTLTINSESVSFLINNTNFNEEEKKNNKEMSSINDWMEKQEEILKIQSNWRRKRDSCKYLSFKEKVFIIQRCVRKFLQKKYNLPDNYYYNEKFLRIQLEKYEKSLLENLRILFPALFEDRSPNKSHGPHYRICQNCAVNSINTSTILQHHPYDNEKIYLFSKILDFDMMIETDEVYDSIWAKSFDSIYTSCLKTNSPIHLIGLGSSHTVCVDSKGKVFSFGWNNYGQCGVPVNSTIIAKDELDSEFLVEMSEHNQLRPRVLNKVEGMKLPQIDEYIFTKSIACGEDHTLLLDHTGALWGYGLNLNGQLGLGHQQFVEKPTKLDNLSKHIITSVKSEGDINFAINDKGESFMWPSGDKEGNINLNPIKLSLASPKEKVTSISCGNNFVLILNNHGLVYSMGKSNNYGQLGHGDTKPRYRPTLIEYFQINNERISQISCGYKHCVAKTIIGHAFTWGLGVKGQLGHNNFNNYSLPYQVKIEGPPTIKVIQISAGFRSTYFLTENRKLYFSGCNGSNSMQSYPIPFHLGEKIPEFNNESNYSVVRIMNTWNKSFSIFYATIADSSSIKSMNLHKLNQILLNLSNKWDCDSVEVPYIETIAKYFTASTMKITKEMKIPNK